MIRIIATGNLGADPVTRQVSNSTVTNFSIASTDHYTNKAGVKTKTTTWLRCTAWNAIGRTLQEHLKLGEKVIIEGSMRNSTYEKDGVAHYSTECIVSSFEFCGSKVQS